MKCFLLCRVILIVLFCAASARLGHAEIIYTVSINTSALVGHPAGPFSLDFQLNDGSGTNDANNTTILSNFTFGVGGSASGSPMLTGGATGDLATQVMLTDSSFLNEFTQGFTPGNSLMFNVMQTTNVDGGSTPDQFTLAIFDNVGAQLPTLSFFDVFVEVDINSPLPDVQSFASDTGRTPAAGGDAINIPQPQITPLGGAIPEPGTLALLGFALLSVGILSARKRF